MSDLKELFAKNLKRIRQSKELTQAALGKKVNKDKAYISQLESGRVGFSADSLELFSKALLIPPAELLRQEKMNFLEATQTLLLSISDTIDTFKEEDKNASDEMSDNGPMIGRLIFLKSAIIDAFKFFLGFKQSVFKGEKDSMNNYSDFFDLYKQHLFEESKDENGNISWKIKPDTDQDLQDIISELPTKKVSSIQDSEKQELINEIISMLPHIDVNHLSLIRDDVADSFDKNKSTAGTGVVNIDTKKLNKP